MDGDNALLDYMGYVDCHRMISSFRTQFLI